MESHLLQMRGLKPTAVRAGFLPLVASFTDAWIETYKEVQIPLYYHVASFTDAWIETYQAPPLRQVLRSHLLQMRGLKRR